MFVLVKDKMGRTFLKVIIIGLLIDQTCIKISFRLVFKVHLLHHASVNRESLLVIEQDNYYLSSEEDKAAYLSK